LCNIAILKKGRKIIKLENNLRFFQTARDVPDDDLVLSNIMGYVDEPDFLIDRNYYYNCIVMFIKEGSLIVEQYGKTVCVKSGEAVMLALQEPHKYYCVPGADGRASHLFFHFNSRSLQRVVQLFEENRRLPIVIKNPRIYEEIVSVFDTAYEKNAGYEFAISGKLYNIVMSFFQSSFIENPITNRFCYMVDLYIDKHIGEKITLEQLCREFGYSKYHFSRKFRACFNTPPIQYVLNRKILYSQKLLCNTNMNIQQIAEGLGFCDVCYFTKAFKKVSGFTPMSYKKNHQEERMRL